MSETKKVEPTIDQSSAIKEDGTNIIVSAGAGSGKTWVLAQRVNRKLKEGIKINQMLILTFTKKAASEMKNRIRKNILSDPAIKENLALLDSSYITTFDSYALSIVKKYNYLLNVSKNITVIDSSVMNLVYQEYLDKIFDELYESKDEDFFKLLEDLTVKDDKDIKKWILSINRKLDLKYDKKEYLNNYLNNYFDDNYIKKITEDYLELLNTKRDYIDKLLTEFSEFVDIDKFDEYKATLDNLLSSSTYLEYKNSLDIPTVRMNGLDDEGKAIREEIKNTIEEIENLTRFDDIDELIDTYKSTSSYVKTIIKIINILDERVSTYKDSICSYEYSDIAKMAIKVLKENKDVREELKNFFNEIMIDEYQDTSDLQDEFISMIDNNNVYMVGDIKQSIYRFRNANPYLFKSKYDNYSNNNGGLKIDLKKNFRSRKDVIDNINLIFTNIMTDKYGGASYKIDHKMVSNYEENNKHFDMEILNYEYDKEIKFSEKEIQIFAVARDIKKKISEHYQIYDNGPRDATYNDFVILLDRSKNFDLFKKIFEYLEIPLTKYSTTNIIDEAEILLVRNIIKLILSYRDNNYDTEYKYALTSVLRSYLFSYNDEEIFKMFKNDNFLDNKAMDIVKEIGSIDSLSLMEIIDIIIEKFDFYNKIILIGDVDSRLTRLDEIDKLFNSLSSLEYDLYMTYDYLTDIIDSEDGIKIDDTSEDSNSVRIMTIHESKGLEFPICYYAFLDAEFNLSDLKERILYNDKYGIITPYFKEGIGNLFTKDLVKNNYLEEEISEKIRLLYVALTRPKEKIILITNFTKKIRTISKARSFLDMLSLIKDDLKEYITDIDINKLDISRDYNLIKASKEIKKLITKEEKDKMKFGTDVHEAFEYLDFRNPNYDSVDPKYINNIKYLVDNIDIDKVINIYKEYEFIYVKDDIKHHGVIDLLLEYEDKYKIIDYKLKNVDDEAYVEQLTEYKNYIESKTTKNVELYLYSIINKEFKEISVK